MNLDQLNKLTENLTLIKEPAQGSYYIGISKIERPRSETISFLKEKKFLKKLGRFSKEKSFSKSLLLIEEKLYEKNKGDEEFEKSIGLFGAIGTIQDVSVAMCALSKFFFDEKNEDVNFYADGRQTGEVEIHPSAQIAQNVFIGEKVRIGKNAKILSGVSIMGRCEIGDDCMIFPNVTIYPDVKIGNNCRFHSGAVIGADGFGYHFHQGSHLKLWHMGGVVIGNNVEVGANSAIDGGTFDETIIEDQVKLDNMVQVGHNCHLGKGVILCGHVAIGGSSRIGDFTVFGGKSGMGDDMELGPGCKIAGGCLVNCDWPAGAVLGGHPGRPLKEWMRGLAYLRKQTAR